MFCFAWSLESFLHPPTDKNKKAYKTSSYNIDETKQKLKEINTQYPVEVNSNYFHKVEEKFDISMCVYTFDHEDVKLRYPIYTTKEIKEKHLNLLLFNKNDVYHYCLIKDFNRFMFDITNSRNKKYFCVKCLLHFYSQEKLNEHYKSCNNKSCCFTKLPDKNTFIEFKNHNKKFRCPFVIYADFESILKKMTQKMLILHKII